MSKTKNVLKFFLLPSYEKEEAFLTQMHQSGWKLKEIGLCRYTFEQCEPANVTYRLDFASDTTDRKAYTDKFREQGWEHLQDLNGYSYFRRNADDLRQDGPFSSIDARMGMIRKSLLAQATALICIFCILPTIVISRLNGTPVIVIGCISGAIALLYAILFICSLVGFGRLKKKYGKN